MKKTFKILFASVCGIMLTVACNKNTGVGGAEEKPDKPLDENFTECLVVSSESAVFDSEDRWKAGEAVSLTDGKTNVKFIAVTSGKSVTFSGDATPRPKTDAYCLFPYLETYEGFPVLMNVPSSCSVSAPGLIRDGFLAAGKIVSDAEGVSARMQEICGAISISLSRNDIKSVSIKGNDGELFGGTLTLSFEDKPRITSVSGGSESFVIEAASGDAMVAGTYVFAAIPATFGKGVTVTYLSSDGSIGIYTGTEVLSLESGTVLDLGSREADAKWSSPQVQTVEKVVNMGTIYSDFAKFFDPIPEATTPFFGYFATPLNGKNEFNYVTYADTVYKYASKSTIRFKGHLVPPVFAHKHLVKIQYKSNAFTPIANFCAPDGTVIKDIGGAKNVSVIIEFDKTLEDGIPYYIDCNIYNAEGKTVNFNLSGIVFTYEGPDVEEVCAVKTVQPEPSGTSVELKGSFDSWNYNESSTDYSAGFEYLALDTGTLTSIDAVLSGKTFSASLNSIATGAYRVHAWAKKGDDCKSYGPDRTFLIAQ